MTIKKIITFGMLLSVLGLIFPSSYVASSLELSEQSSSIAATVATSSAEATSETIEVTSTTTVGEVSEISPVTSETVALGSKIKTEVQSSTVKSSIFTPTNLTGQYDKQYVWDTDMETDHCPGRYHSSGVGAYNFKASCDDYLIHGKSAGHATIYNNKSSQGGNYVNFSLSGGDESWRTYENGNTRHMKFNNSGDTTLDQWYNSKGVAISDPTNTGGGNTGSGGDTDTGGNTGSGNGGGTTTAKPTSSCTYTKYSNGKTKSKICKRSGKVDYKWFYNSKGVPTSYEDWNNGKRIQLNSYYTNGRVHTKKYLASSGKVDYKWIYTSTGAKSKYEDWDGKGHKLQSNTYKSGKAYGKFFYTTAGKTIKYEQWRNGNKVQINSYTKGRVTLKRYNNSNGTVNHKDYWSHGKVVKREYYKNGKVYKTKHYN